MKDLTIISILTYNEVSNIEDCIKSVQKCHSGKIVVYDGGSNDDTIRIVEKLGIEIVVKPGTSISERRSMALENARQKEYDYILFVDADQRLLDVETHRKAMDVFGEDHLVAGIQLNIVQPTGEIRLNYWQKGFYSRHNLISANFQLKNVIGTPCYFKIEIVKEFIYDQGKINGPSDDTFFCKQISSSGYKLFSVNISCTEIVRATFKSTMRKAYWYGIGDAEYILNEKLPSNRRNHLFHVLLRNPVINPIKNLNQLFFFYAAFGFSRLIGFLYYFIFRPSKYLNKS